METRTLETKTQNPQEEQAANEFVNQICTHAKKVYEAKQSVCKEADDKLDKCRRQKEEWTEHEISEQDHDEAQRDRERIQFFDRDIAAFEEQKKAAEEQATEFAIDFFARALVVENSIRSKKEKPSKSNPQRPTESFHV